MPILSDPDMKHPGAMRYPHLGDPKPKPNTRVMLIRADGSHGAGVWTDDCKAWSPQTAAEKRRYAAKQKEAAE
jgi:hypothetical protein